MNFLLNAINNFISDGRTDLKKSEFETFYRMDLETAKGQRPFYYAAGGGQCLVGNFKRNDSASSRIADHELYQNQVAALSHLCPQELWKIENILKMMMRFDDMT